MNGTFWFPTYPEAYLAIHTRQDNQYLNWMYARRMRRARTLGYRRVRGAL